ncbi:MAG: hypothetical protein Q9199_003808 [Rusavskia elegans]
MLLQTTTLAILIHLTSHLCTSQSIGKRINQFNPQWHCNVDSWESTNEDCDKAIDSNDNTFWHSQYNPTDEPLPHRITIDMGKVYNVRSLTYLPRQDGQSNGNIGNWRISLAEDEEAHRALNGTWADDSIRKTVDFGNATRARFVQLDAFTEAGGRGTWSSVAQIDIYEDNGSNTPNPPSKSNASRFRNSTSTEPTARVAVVDGTTVTLGPRPTGGRMAGGYRNSTRTMGMSSSSTATATSSSTTGGDTATSAQTTPTATSGEGSSRPPADSSDAMSGRVPGVGVAMVGLAVAVVMASMFFQV